MKTNVVSTFIRDGMFMYLAACYGLKVVGNQSPHIVLYSLCTIIIITKEMGSIFDGYLEGENLQISFCNHFSSMHGTCSLDHVFLNVTPQRHRSVSFVIDADACIHT